MFTNKKHNFTYLFHLHMLNKPFQNSSHSSLTSHTDNLTVNLIE